MANSELEKYMYPFEKREKMRKHPTYEAIKEPWENGLYATSQKVGSLSYLIRDAHQKVQAKGRDYLSRANWGKYYLNTGKIRLDKKAEQVSDDYYKINKYNGRTLDDLLEIAKAFYKDCTDNYGIKLTPQAALNIVYMKVVDDTFTEYQRNINTILNLKSKLPEYTFELTDGLTYDNNAVDVIVSLKGDIVGGLQILPESAKNKEQKQSKMKSEVDQKHDLFEMMYGVRPQKIYASSTGYMKNPIPSFD